MRRSALAIAAIAAASIAVAGMVRADSAGNSLYILDHAFVLKPEALQEPRASDRLGDPAPRKVPLVLWTKLAGNAEGIARLKLGGFKLVHKWTINCGRSDDNLPQNLLSEIPFDFDGNIPWPQVAAELEKEIPLNENREFDWRTVSQRDYVVGCKYTVRIVDELDNELHCAPLGKPCILSIGVRRQ
jgi:hypothetical protein